MYDDVGHFEEGGNRKQSSSKTRREADSLVQRVAKGYQEG
jgi:hypothetical protein